MSRSGYSDECDDNWALICWRGAVASAIRGRRGQAFLAEMLQALDEMPDKRLVTNDLIHDGEVCAIGAVGRKRDVDMTGIEPEDYVAISDAFGIAEALVQEIEWYNDEGAGYWSQETPEARWQRMRSWVERQIKQPEMAA